MTKKSRKKTENHLVVQKQWIAVLRKNAFRLTSPREAVIEILAGSRRALTATEIFESARESCPSLGLVSVYRTLEILEELGLIQRVHQSESCHAYIAGSTGHQHLLICRYCGRAEFFEGDNLLPLIERVTVESGYHVDDHWLQLFGICPDCRVEMGRQ